MVPSRCLHYALVVLVWAAVALPNLGGPSLWDIDEGNNAEAAREMFVSGDWVVPTFNYRLRTDKPALLYWCQIAAYNVFGVNEFAARLPSALAALLAALAAYELARGMFNPATGLLAGVMLPTCLLFCIAGHFANPDALLTLSLTLSFGCFWAWYRGVGWAIVPCGVAMGLGVLAKGPVAVVLPVLVWGTFLLAQKELWRAFRIEFLLCLGCAFLVAAPWYTWVAVETKGRWLMGFWFNHNQGRFLAPMESHGGSVVYYLPVLLLGLAPWSLFVLPALGEAVRKAWHGSDDRLRYLVIWAGVYLAFFSCAATKLPNYVLPIYPALVIVTAARLVRWQAGEALPGWVLPATLVTLLAAAGGFVVVPSLLEMPGVGSCAWLGLAPLAGAALLAWHLYRPQVRTLLLHFTALATVSLAVLAGWTPELLNAHKASKPLAAALPADHLDRDVRLVVLDAFQPSLVFYSGRMVEFLSTADEIGYTLSSPQPTYLLLRREQWDEFHLHTPSIGREVARSRDLYARTEVVLVTNEKENCLAATSSGARQ